METVLSVMKFERMCVKALETSRRMKFGVCLFCWTLDMVLLKMARQCASASLDIPEIHVGCRWGCRVGLWCTYTEHLMQNVVIKCKVYQCLSYIGKMLHAYDHWLIARRLMIDLFSSLHV